MPDIFDSLGATTDTKTDIFDSLSTPAPAATKKKNPQSGPQFAPQQGFRSFAERQRFYGTSGPGPTETMDVGPIRRTLTGTGEVKTSASTKQGRKAPTLQTEIATMPGAKGVLARAAVGSLEAMGFGMAPTPTNVIAKLLPGGLGAFTPATAAKVATGIGAAIMAPEVKEGVRTKDWGRVGAAAFVALAPYVGEKVATDIGRRFQDAAQKGIVTEGDLTEGDLTEHPGVPQRANVPVNRVQVRKGTGQQAGGGGGTQRGAKVEGVQPEVQTQAEQAGAAQTANANVANVQNANVQNANAPQAQGLRQVGPELPVVTSNRGVDFEVVRQGPEGAVVRIKGGNGAEFHLTPEDFQTKFPPKPAPPPETPAPTVAPQVEPTGTTPKPVTEATGLANQVQAREAEARILSEVEPTRGKSPEAWQKIGQKVLDNPENPDANYEGLARRVADGEVELTGERVGALLEGKRRLVNAVNEAKAALDQAPGDKTAMQQYADARMRLDDYVTNVQAGKGRWSDVGRALQAGTELDTGNFAEVLQEARRVGSKVPDAKIKELTDQVAQRDERIAALEQQTRDIQADRAVQRLNRERRTGARIADIQTRRADAIRRLMKTSGQLQAGIDPAQARAFYDWARTYAEEGVVRLDDIVQKAQEDLGWQRDDVIAHLAARMSEYRPQSEIQRQMRQLKGQAGAEARIAELKRQLETGEFAPPNIRQKAVDQQIENLRMERDYWSQRVKQATRPPESLVKRGVTVGSSLIRGWVLGTDAGQMMRQGLFFWGRLLKGDPAAIVSTGKATRAAFSEHAMQALERHAQEAHAPDGRLYAAVEKKAGLQTTDRFLNPEEMGIGHYLGQIPVIGPALERAQTTFINEARRSVFRAGVDAGFTPAELKERASFINNVSGRGNIRKVPDQLQIILTGPRYEASRWATLGEIMKSPVTAARALHNPAARANVTDLAATAASVYLLFKASEMAGYTVNYDPNSPDFLKMRRGNEVWDVSAGLAPRIRDVMRLVMYWSHPDYRSTMKDVAANALTRTVSPAVRTPAEQASYAYQRSQGVPESAIKSPFTGFGPDESDQGPAEFSGIWPWTPLILKTFYQTTTEEKSLPAGIGATIKEFVGTSVNRYPPRSAGQSGSSRPTKIKVSKGLR